MEIPHMSDLITNCVATDYCDEINMCLYVVNEKCVAIV